MSTAVKYPKILVFTTSRCPHCHSVKNYLRAYKIPFREVNVEKSQSAARDLVRMTGQTGVPVIKIGSNKPIVGFDRAKINRILKLK
ncbi:NrdH-redoxin [bacterium]|nr:NrdH-redoxin [bacterium]